MPDSKQNEEYRSDAIKCDCFQVHPQPLDVNSCLSAFKLSPLPRRLLSSSYPTRKPPLAPAPSFPAPLSAPSSPPRPKSPNRASDSFRTPPAAPAPAQST